MSEHLRLAIDEIDAQGEPPPSPAEYREPNATREIVDVFVPGTPQPAGSKRAFNHKTTGKLVVTDDNPRSKAWKKLVRDFTWSQTPLGWAPLEGPLIVELAFVLSRPKGHYRAGRYAHLLKDSAPPYPIVKPDALKLARAVEDALTTVLWGDDAQIVHETLSKRYGAPEGVRVVVWRA